MGELLKGKTILEAQEIIDNYMAMVDEEAYDEELLDEAIAFQNVGKQANRIKCATIGWNGIQEILNDTKKGEEDGQ